MKKNILLIGNFPPPYGGVPAHIASLAPYLAQNGWNVIVLSSGYPAGIHHEDDVKIYKPSTFQNVVQMLNPAISLGDVISFSYLFKLSFKRYFGMLLFANRVARIIKRERIDVISAYHLYAGLAALPAVRKTKIPLINTIFGEVFSEKKFYQKISDKVRDLLDNSSSTLSCSQHCGGSLEQIGLEDLVETHYYGVDTNYFNPDKNSPDLRSESGWADEDKIIIFVGRMTGSMGLQTVLEAIPGLIGLNRSIRFLLCGAEGPLTPDALQMQQKYPRDVQVLTNVDKEKLAKCYAASDIAVAPSINERACLGLAIIEAMSSELPVVACRIGGTPEVVSDGQTGLLIPPQDSSALSSAILKLLENKDMCESMGSLGRQVAVEKFSIKKANLFALKKFESLTSVCTSPDVNVSID